jgi:hypothetical protein
MPDYRLVKKAVAKLYGNNILTFGEVFRDIVAQVKRALIVCGKGRGEHVVTNAPAIYVKNVKTEAEYQAFRAFWQCIKCKALAQLDSRSRAIGWKKSTLCKSYPFSFFRKVIHINTVFSVFS